MVRFLFLAALCALPTLAQAHPGHGSATGLIHGVGHPLGGLDHLLAMIAVGLWAAQTGGRALWAVPVGFVGAMALGGALGMAQLAVPGVESGIILSVLILGVLITASIRLPLAASIALVVVFAICHGHAHGAEMPASASGLLYGIGFMIATAVLHLAGICLSVAPQKIARASIVRYAGACIALVGVWMLVG
jgi:urease accessory protein